MKTNKPISTISYNTEPFLKMVLDELVERHVLDFYAFIYHYAESDEEGKNHYHLYMEPNGQIDTDYLRDMFKEIDPINPLKPLGTIRIERTLHFGDWYLYCLHDVDYLLTKFQKREFHYRKEDFIVSDKMTFNELIHHIDFSKYTKQREILSNMGSIEDLINKVKNGQIPITQMKAYKDLIDAIDELNYRNGRPNHNPSSFGVQQVITDDGEIIDIGDLKQ